MVEIFLVCHIRLDDTRYLLHPSWTLPSRRTEHVQVWPLKRVYFTHPSHPTSFWEYNPQGRVFDSL
jgi:hypothetical protein